MIDHFQFCRNELNFCTDEFFTNTNHLTATCITDLFTFIKCMEHFCVWKIFNKFLALSCIFSFSEMLFGFD